jgi:hypothetical protein
MRGRLLVLACAVLPVLGCGGTRVAPVSGRVTLNGAPLANAKVIFQPIPRDGVNVGPASQGDTNAQGEYTLKLISGGKDGAVVGEHLVSVSALQGSPPDPKIDNPPPRKELVPERYNAKTELKFEVPASGATKADFALTGQPGRPAPRPGSGS